jgi:hypothetical protein
MEGTEALEVLNKWVNIKDYIFSSLKDTKIFKENLIIQCWGYNIFTKIYVIKKYESLR